MEQAPLYNAINWSFGAAGVMATTFTSTTQIRLTNANGGPDSIPQMTVLVASITSFLCPSDSNPGPPAPSRSGIRPSCRVPATTRGISA